MARSNASRPPYECKCQSLFDDVSGGAGTACRLQDPCAANPSLKCTGCTAIDIPGQAPTLQCACQAGYRRPSAADNYTVPCSVAINPCVDVPNGGCDMNAECSYLGPGMRSCRCAEGFTGDGVSCMFTNPCVSNPCAATEVCSTPQLGVRQV